MSIVIKVDHISKQYRLGAVGTGSLRHDLNRSWHKLRGKEDPYITLGESNDRTTKASSDYVWALKDINFEVGQGEVLGIIGRNGAGKSTLLKILSRTTSPTLGEIRIKGRVASLLEVGTGFHGELSGRENIFLNGAIMGMSKAEIKSKLDEIIDFAGVERYIDTPVKRYSSGMYVRLAFGVAAHLEPEILIVDEVLAVGDAEFQKKALGKMQDVSTNQGRTVLFVSHNLSSVKTLCTRGIVLENGMLLYDTDVEQAVSQYYSKQISKNAEIYFREGNKNVEIIDIGICDHLKNERTHFLMGEDIYIGFAVLFHRSMDNVEIGINFKNPNHDLMFHACNFDDQFTISGSHNEVLQIRVRIPNISLTPGSYILDIGAVVGKEKLDILQGFSEVYIDKGPIVKRPNPYPSHASYFSPSQWNIIENNAG